MAAIPSMKDIQDQQAKQEQAAAEKEKRDFILDQILEPAARER